MTKFQFTSDLLNIINALLQADINGCSVHEARCYLDELFDDFEEQEGIKNDETSNRADLEHYSYLIDSLHEEGYNLWLEDKDDNTDTPKEDNPLNALNHLFPDLECDLNALTLFPSEGGSDGTV